MSNTALKEYDPKTRLAVASTHYSLKMEHFLNEMFKSILRFYMSMFLMLTKVLFCIGGWFVPRWFSWTSFSDVMLRSIEKRILSYLKLPYRGWFVDIGPVVGPADKIWTISMNADSPKTPLVLLHGLGAGVALWCLNLDALAATRPVYAIDLLGFGRSSRPEFSVDAEETEMQLVKSVEEWRHEMKLDKFILLGHSMGGFLAASYAINHPEHVKHLILADPWGFPEKPSTEYLKREIPFWVRAIAIALSPFNPLAAIRAAGPFGQWVVDRTRPDLARKFENAFGEDENLITQYIYQCNAQTPSGESAFRSMTYGFGWAKNPIINRIHTMDKSVPITVLYGSRSWIDNSAGEIIKKTRVDSYVKVQAIVGAGHHVYADKSDLFNKYVNDACDNADGVPTNPNLGTMIASSSERNESDVEADDDDTKKSRASSIKL